MIRVHVWGASGYAAAEALRLLHRHPFVELGALESRSHAGQTAGDHIPLLRTSGLRFDGPGSVVAAARDGDVAILAGSHGEALEVVPALLQAGVRVIDLSADYRSDASAAYGLSEFEGDAVANAQLVANPGCYPTASLLALLPLASLDARPVQIVIDAKSGITGAGRNPSLGALYAEVSGDVRAYGLDGHRHQAEMERRLRAYGMDADVTFTPHVVPLARGMLACVYAIFATPPATGAVDDALAARYGASPFVRVLGKDRTPSVAAVTGTNDAELRVDVRGCVVRAICAIDNLGKGAAGQAVQNLNIMLGFPQESGFDDRAVVA